MKTLEKLVGGGGGKVLEKYFSSSLSLLYIFGFINGAGNVKAFFVQCSICHILS